MKFMKGYGKEMKSVLQDKKECYVCHKQTNLHLHHIYFGKNRKVSDKNGFTCYLCYDHHEGTYGVHGMNGHELDMKLKRDCQLKFEKTKSREEFITLIGRNYL